MSVRVVARIRPLLKAEREADSIVQAPPTEPSKPPSIVRIPNPKNEAESFSFSFNSVYDQDTTQQELFDAEGTHFRHEETSHYGSLGLSKLHAGPPAQEELT